MGKTYFRNNDFDITKDANNVLVIPESYLPRDSVLRIDSYLRRRMMTSGL